MVETGWKGRHEARNFDQAAGEKYGRGPAMMALRPKLMVLGNARHGKDTVCEIMCREHGLTFESSSHFVALRAVEPYLKERGITYPNFDAMYADRVNHREAWFKAIELYNKDDGARLAKELYAQYDVYCGLRSKMELDALRDQGVVDFVIWVDASRRLPPEPGTSITVTQADADYILDNNGPLEILGGKVAAAVAAARWTHEHGKHRLRITD